MLVREPARDSLARFSWVVAAAVDDFFKGLPSFGSALAVNVQRGKEDWGNRWRGQFRASRTSTKETTFRAGSSFQTAAKSFQDDESTAHKVWHAPEPSAKNGGGTSSDLFGNVGPRSRLCKIRSRVRLDLDRESVAESLEILVARNLVATQ